MGLRAVWMTLESEFNLSKASALSLTITLLQPGTQHRRIRSDPKVHNNLFHSRRSRNLHHIDAMCLRAVWMTSESELNLARTSNNLLPRILLQPGTQYGWIWFGLKVFNDFLHSQTSGSFHQTDAMCFRTAWLSTKIMQDSECNVDTPAMASIDSKIAKIFAWNTLQSSFKLKWNWSRCSLVGRVLGY